MSATTGNSVPRRMCLRRHLALIIAIKVLALTMLWWFFFRSELRPPAGTEAVAEQILCEQHGARQWRMRIA